MKTNRQLETAYEEKDVEGVKTALARGADPNLRIWDEEHTVLYWAVFAGHHEIVRILLDAGAKVSADLSSEEDETMLHVAAEHGDLQMVNLLLKEDGAAILNSFNYIDRTPLMCAVERGFHKVAQALIRAGADVNAHNETRIGDTALKMAVESGNAVMVRLLLDAGADPLIPGWMQVTPLHKAQERKKPEGAQIREMLEDACRKRGVDPKVYEAKIGISSGRKKC